MTEDWSGTGEDVRVIFFFFFQISPHAFIFKETSTQSTKRAFDFGSMEQGRPNYSTKVRVAPLLVLTNQINRSESSDWSNWVRLIG